MKTFLKNSLLLIAGALFMIALLDIKNAGLNRPSKADQSEAASTQTAKTRDAKNDAVKSVAMKKPVGDRSAEPSSVSDHTADAGSAPGKDGAATFTGGVAPKDRVADKADETLRVVASKQAKVIKDAVGENDQASSPKKRRPNDGHRFETIESKTADKKTADDVAADTAMDDKSEESTLAAKQAVMDALDKITERLQQSNASKSARNPSDLARSDDARMDFGALGDVGPLLGMQMRKGRDSVTIGRLLRGGPAHRAGLLSGDTVVAVNRIPVMNTEEFAAAVSKCEPGEAPDVFVKRGEAWRKFTLPIPDKKPKQ